VILAAERLVQQSNHHFVRIRFLLPKTLGALFIACIVLLMKTCTHNHKNFEHELEDGEIAKALEIL
jgi:hypothetical protein